MTLWDPRDCSLPGSSIHEILHARILEWVAIPFTKGSTWLRDQTWLSYIARQILYCPSQTHTDEFQNGFASNYVLIWASQVALVVKNPPANSGNTRHSGSIPGLGRSPGGGQGNSLQYSCLENSMDRGVWQATVHGVTPRVRHDWANTWIRDL